MTCNVGDAAGTFGLESCCATGNAPTGTAVLLSNRQPWKWGVTAVLLLGSENPTARSATAKKWRPKNTHLSDLD